MLEFCPEPYCRRAAASSAAVHRARNLASANYPGMTPLLCESVQQLLWNDNVYKDEARFLRSGPLCGGTLLESAYYGDVAPREQADAKCFRMTTFANVDVQPLWNDNVYKKGGGYPSRAHSPCQTLPRRERVPAKRLPTGCASRGTQSHQELRGAHISAANASPRKGYQQDALFAARKDIRSFAALTKLRSKRSAAAFSAAFDERQGRTHPRHAMWVHLQNSWELALK